MRVLTMGTFDLLHPGHLHLLRACRKLAGDSEVVVAVNRDEFVERYKGHAPAMGEWERRSMVAALDCVDSVILNDGDEFAGRVIQRYGPCLLVIGADWRDRDYLAQLRVRPVDLDRWQVYGPVYVPLLGEHSSTRLRERVTT
jgi:cytidyltransferase-like protein